MPDKQGLKSDTGRVGESNKKLELVPSPKGYTAAAIGVVIGVVPENDFGDYPPVSSQIEHTGRSSGANVFPDVQLLGAAIGKVHDTAVQIDWRAFNTQL